MVVFQQSLSQKIPGKNILLSKMKISCKTNKCAFCISFMLSNISMSFSYDHGGVLLSTKKDIEQLTPPLLNSKRQPHGKEPNW